MRNSLRILSGGLASIVKLDATGTPLPCAPREGLVFELRCRGCPLAQTWRIRKVNSRSFYVANWGRPPIRMPIEAWDDWLDALMREGELRLADCSVPCLKLIEGEAR